MNHGRCVFDNFNREIVASAVRKYGNRFKMAASAVVLPTHLAFIIYVQFMQKLKKNVNDIHVQAVHLKLYFSGVTLYRLLMFGVWATSLSKWKLKDSLLNNSFLVLNHFRCLIRTVLFLYEYSHNWIIIIIVFFFAVFILQFSLWFHTWKHGFCDGSRIFGYAFIAIMLNMYNSC